MKVPNAENAVIAPEKLRDYLLNPDHRRGGSKAKLLLAMGYRVGRWQQLETDLREQHLTARTRSFFAVFGKSTLARSSRD